MESLSTCNCTKDTNKLTEDEITKLLPEIEGWEIVSEDGIKMLKRKFVTRIFKRSMKFVNKIAVLAEEVQHHPKMIVEFPSVTVLWWSHTIEGLHKNDFILASKTSELFESMFEK